LLPYQINDFDFRILKYESRVIVRSTFADLLVLMLIYFGIAMYELASMLHVFHFKNSFAVLFSSKFAVKLLLKLPPLLVYVATIPCDTLVSENK